MAQYRSKAVVEAIQWHTPADHPDIQEGGQVRTVSGLVQSSPGDWLLLIANNKIFMILNDSAFTQMYEAV